MKKKFLNIILAICLILPCSIMFTACDFFKSPEHECVVTETYGYDSSQHWFKCEDETCEEKLNPEDHEFDEGVLVDTTKTYTCIHCNYETDEHVCKATYIQYDDSCHKIRCKDPTCNLGLIYSPPTLHTFEKEFVAVENGYNVVSTCECGLETSIQAITFNNSIDGVVEVIEENVQLECWSDVVNNDIRVVFMPKPNEGRYFLKWEVKTLGEIDFYTGKENLYQEPSIDYFYNTFLSPTQEYIKEYTPIFTDGVEDVVFYDIDISGQSDLNHGVYCLQYYAAESKTPIASFYIKSNSNLMLGNAHIVENSSESIVHRFSIDDDNMPLPYETTLGTDGAPIKILYIKLIDLRDKIIIRAGDRSHFNGEPSGLYNYFPAKPGEKVSIYSTQGNVYGSYITGWEDELGNFVSDQKVLDIVAEKNTTYYTLTADLDYYDQSNPYGLTLNNDDTFTIQKCYMDNEPITIPEIINGKKITAISNNAFAYNKAMFKITIPATIKDIDNQAFAHIESGCEIIIEGDRDDLTPIMFTKPVGPNSMLLYLTQNTVKNMINNLVNTFIEDVDLEIVFETDEHLDGALGHYEMGTRKVCLPTVSETSFYSVSALWVWAHEIRHFYQAIVMGNVEGLDKTDLLIQPTDLQIEAWNQPYVDPDEDYDGYWNHPLEVDARDFATELLGFSPTE